MYTQVNAENYKAAISSAGHGMLLCSKKLCPHCKNMEKVMEKFSAQRPQVALFKLDSEEDPQVMADLGAERVPTMLILRDGKVVAAKTGLMNPRELIALFDNSV